MTSPSPAAPATEPGTAPAELIGRSPGQLMRRRFRRDRAGVVSAFVVVFFFLVAVGAPLISMVYGKDPTTTYGLNETGLLNQFGYPVQPNGGISGRFWFGLEPTLGRDVLTQLAYGIRTSLLIAAAATALCVVTGVLVGVTAELSRRQDGLLPGPLHRSAARLPATAVVRRLHAGRLRAVRQPGEGDPDLSAGAHPHPGAVGAGLDGAGAAAARPGAEPAGAGVRRGGQGDRRLALADHHP
ncbi:hypothetical protein GCM10020000_28520 [Streptomyces olivoverticillatus]